MEHFNIVVGDHSGDGHGLSETYTIETNWTLESIKVAYKRGTKKLGFDVTKTLCTDYEDNRMDAGYAEKLTAAGYHFDSTDCVFPDEFLEIYFFVVKLGNKEFTYSHVNNKTQAIGGYGLFI